MSDSIGSIDLHKIAKPSIWRDYLELCKPRVVALMLLTAIVGMLLAAPGAVPLNILFFGTMGIALAAGAAASINHLIDRQLDAKMNRTHRRPIPTGKIAPINAIIFAGVLALLAMAILLVFVNTLTAVLSLATLIGYAVIYTVFLKRATPQNIVIGGATGAAPPLLGWTAVTGHLDPQSLLLVLIIFVWTPPHFWALAIHRHKEYLKADIPMLPVTHGVRFTKICIVLYTLLLLASSLLPFTVGMMGWPYLIAAVILGLWFLYWTLKLMYTEEKTVAMKTFWVSIYYLILLFSAMLIDHFI